MQDKPSARREMGVERGIGEKRAEQTGAVRQRKRMYNLRPKGRNAIMNGASGNGYFRSIRMRPLRAVFRQAGGRAPIRGIFQPVPESASRVIFRRIPGVSPRLIILRQASENPRPRYLPVEPKPPSPRTVSESSCASSNSAVIYGTTTSCAIRSPGSTV